MPGVDSSKCRGDNGAAQVLLGGRVRDERGRFVARDFEHVGVAHDAADLQGRQAGLARTEEFAGAAQLHVHLGDVEAVSRIDQGADALAGEFAHFGCDQDAVALLGAAADASAQLVHLRETEALGLFDHHHGRVRYVHAYFDHRG